MKLSDFKDEKALEVVGDLLEPISRIVQDKASAAKRSNGIEFARYLLKEHKTDVLEMLAILNDTPVNDYHCNAATVFADVIDMLTDPELMALFGLQRVS